MVNEVKVKCRSCGEQTNLEVYASLNVAENPELKERVKDGSLFVWECPACGTRNLCAYNTLYHDPDAKLMVWLYPSATDTSEFEAVDAKMRAIAGSLDGYTLRRAASVGDLIEKVNISDAGLDDAVVEMCKYITKMEMTEKKSKEEADEIMAAPFRFYRMSGADNEITFSFPLKGAMQGLNVGFNVYEDCRGILGRNPAAKVPKGFAKIDSEWLSRYFR